jgi:HlyD family secretion protein
MHNVRKSATILVLAAMVAAPFVLLPLASTRTLAPAAAQQASNDVKWSAAAPGRVEPKDGEYRLAAATLGRIVEVRVKAGEKVQAGQVIVRLDDAELNARLVAAQAEAALKKFARDDQGPSGRLKRRYDADDAVVAAEQKQIAARAALDRALEAAHDSASRDADVAKATAQLQSAEAALAKARTALADIKAEAGEPRTNPYETALIAANSQVSVVQALIEQTRIRAPVAGTALQVGARIGDMASPQTPEPLAVIGDLSSLRVRAEVDERDVSRVKPGQKVVVRTDAFRNRDFPGTVTSIARGLAASKLSPRGPRRQSEADVLEVFVAFDDAVPFPPGMRVDVYFTATE